MLELASLSEDSFTIISHAAFPGRSARIKKSKFCDGGVKSVSVFLTLPLAILTCRVARIRVISTLEPNIYSSTSSRVETIPQQMTSHCGQMVGPADPPRWASSLSWVRHIYSYFQSVDIVHMHGTGPCLVTGPNTTQYNPYSWNNDANIFFIDQPVGVGLSYDELGDDYVPVRPSRSK